MVFEYALSPVLLQLGPVQIRWYGVMWALGFLVTYWYVRAAARQKLIKLTDDDVDWLMVWLTVGTLLGARIFEVFVYRWQYYAANPAEIIALWHGGLSFHGGFLGALVAGAWFARRRKVSFLNLCDTCIIPVALAQAFGRVGNFINGELPGRVTSLPWGVKFPGVEGYRHPSQLYEAAYDVVIFAILWTQRKRKLPHGAILALFLMLYSVFRFLTEYVREPEMYVGPFTMGQALNIPLFIGGIALWFWVKRKH